MLGHCCVCSAPCTARCWQHRRSVIAAGSHTAAAACSELQQPAVAAGCLMRAFSSVLSAVEQLLAVLFFGRSRLSACSCCALHCSICGWDTRGMHAYARHELLRDPTGSGIFMLCRCMLFRTCWHAARCFTSGSTDGISSSGGGIKSMCALTPLLPIHVRIAVGY